MLLRYTFANHKSVKDLQELSLIASSLSDDRGDVIDVEGIPYKLLRVAAVYGSNASGKSNVVSALQFVHNAVQNSQTRWQPDKNIPRSPFLLDDESREKPSEFTIDFLVGGTRFEYGFAVTDAEVIHEYLYAYPSNRKQLWFERRGGADKGFVFGKKLGGENRVIENLTRPNSLFLSAAAQNNHQQLSPVYNWFSSRLRFRSGGSQDPSFSQIIEICSGNPKSRETVLSLLAAADLGIADLEITETELDEKWAKFSEKFILLMKEVDPDVKVDAKTVVADRKHKVLQLKHRGGANRLIPIPIHAESAGTLSYLGLIGSILEVLSTGGVLFVDELDSSLHPFLVAEIVRTFNKSDKNPLGAQLVFNTHDTNLLNSSEPNMPGQLSLRRDQVWFTEKEHSGITRLFPLSDFKTRKEQNIQRSYLQGRFGGVPGIKPLEVPVSSDGDE